MMLLQLYKNFETLFLLCLCPWGDEEKKELTAELDKLGIDGRDFYNRNYRVVEQYYHAFEKHRVSSPGSALLHEMDETVLAVCANVLAQNPDWFSDAGLITNDAAQAAVNRALISENYSESGDLIAELEETGLTDRAKWQMIVLQQKAGQQLKLIAEAVAANLPAYEKACLKVETELKLLLQRFNERIAKTHKTGLLRLPEQISPDTVVIPTLALPTAIFMLEDICFYGLLNDKLSAGGTRLSKDELIMGAKALSEKSKVEILTCLKVGSRYNLEIAGLVGLTPATVSHHMNALLTSGFVELEKRDGKVYYRLATEGVNNFLAGVKRLLLS